MHGFDYNTDLHLGPIRMLSHVIVCLTALTHETASALQSFMLGAGYPTEVGVWTRSFPMPTRLTSKEVLNQDGRKAWHPDGPTQGRCVWEMHGVWGWDVNKNEGVVLRENYFVRHPMTNKKVRVVSLVPCLLIVMQA